MRLLIRYRSERNWQYDCGSYDLPDGCHGTRNWVSICFWILMIQFFKVHAYWLAFAAGSVLYSVSLPEENRIGLQLFIGFQSDSPDLSLKYGI
jgi:hypothetical protein